MQVHILGGMGGVSPGFNATSYLIDKKLLIDAGSCATTIPISEQAQIDNILISHCHLDHIKDLAFICDNCFGMRKDPFQVHANQPILDGIRMHLLNDIIWPDFTKLPSKNNPTMALNTLQPGEEVELAGYRILPITVNHMPGSLGFIIEKDNKSLVFTMDTGPTEEIWKEASKKKNLKGIFCEVSFPNSLTQVAIDSQHHTPNTLASEIEKMPANVPIYLGHIKPNFKQQLLDEVAAIQNQRITILENDGALFHF